MLDLSFGTALILLALTIGTIIATHLLKRIKAWKSSVATIPSACLVIMAALLVFELVADPPFTVADAGVIVIIGLVIGGAAAGLHAMTELATKALKKALKIK